MHSETAHSGWRKLQLTLEMIKFEHSIFALPFALTGAMLAVSDAHLALSSVLGKLFWIIAAMVGARSAAMAFNRLLDAEIDSRNPRTKMRHIPAGLLSTRFAWGFLVAMCALLVFAAAMLNPLCLWLSPVALAVVLFYSYTKRFTATSHLVLGFALGIAPAAAWIAIRGSLDPRIGWLTLAVMLWTAGFDVIYSCQDYDFDRQHGLFSLPARLGVSKALLLSRLFHIGMLACLVALAWSFSLGWLSAVGILCVALLLAYEHSLVSPTDLSRVNAAFFTVNGYVSLLFFCLWAADLLWRKT